MRRILTIATFVFVGLVCAGVAGAAAWMILHAFDGATVTVRGREVIFLTPIWFLLAAVIPIFFALTFLSLTDLSRRQQLTQAAFRSLVVMGLAVGLARPAWTTTDDKVATVILVDVSDSVSDKQLDAARGWAKALAGARAADDKVYLITFAERPHLVRGDDPLKIERHPGAGAGTDIQAALQLGYGLFPPGHVRRMVIVSDGNQTRGDVLVEAYRAAEFEVKISWQSFPQDRVQEIRVAGITIPDEVKQGSPFNVSAEIWSTHEEEVTLALQQDEFPNPLEPRKKVKLHEGVNKVDFKSQANRAGFTSYRLRLVDAKGDTEKANNSAVMSTPVKGKPTVLYVEGGIMREPGSAAYLKKALEHENMTVDVRPPRGLPSTAKELERYDLVLVSDIPIHFMGMSQMRALEGYVRDLGGGLIVAGGEDSFGSGGYQNTVIEKIMPVRFDSEKTRDQPNVALVLVVDRSGSMAGAKIEAAKESARATAEALSPSDLLGVVAFDSQPTTIVRLQRASNRMRISNDIAKLVPGGGTNIYPAMKEAFDILSGAKAKVKHVIVLSDGQAPYDGIADLAQDMRANRITVSAVGIGDADRNLLSMIAENGDGRLYMTEDLSSLPRIFMRETTEAQKSSLVEDKVHAHVIKRVECIEGTGVDAAPALHGYVSTKPKPLSETILVSDKAEPILARWKVGLGNSVAWTSDVKNRWAVEWIRWGGYPKFFGQLVRCTMRRKTYDSYDLYAKVVDGKAQITVDAVDVDDRFVNELDTTLEVIDPKDSKVKKSVPMVQTAAGRYQADFQVDRYGSYLLKAVHRRDGRIVAESTGAVALSYPEEYLRTTPDEAPLRHAAMVSGGLHRPRPPQIWDPAGEEKTYTQDLWPWVLLGVALLILLDIYLKRVRIFGYRTIKFT